MICKPCRLAGLLLSESRPIFAEAEDIPFWHSKCKGGCDCQHVTRSVLRQEAKREGQ